MEGFRFCIPYSVRISDINYGGHVSNAAVLHYFQDARIAYLAALGPFSELDVGDGCGLILPEAQVWYRAQMFLGDALQIGVSVREIGRSSVRMAYRIERAGEVTAEGLTPMVVFDYGAGRPQRVSPALRAAVARVEGWPDGADAGPEGA